MIFKPRAVTDHFCHFLFLEKQSAEAQVSNFKFNFRDEDPDHRVRVQAIIQKTIEEAQSKINKKLFAKHLENSKLDLKKVIDSKKARAANNAEVRLAFYLERDEKILREEQFDIEEEKEYQKNNNSKFEKNQSKYLQTTFSILNNLNN